MQFLAPKAFAFITLTLDNETLGEAATLSDVLRNWADNIKSNSAFKWSSALHYVDVGDDPPSSCLVDEERDCSDGRCFGIISQANYTSRLIDDSPSTEQTSEALKSLGVSFIGDVGQPLHAEAFEVGGNSISVKCSGSSTDLQSLNSGLINQRLDNHFDGSVSDWVDDLVARIKIITLFISCSSTTEPARRGVYTVETDVKNHLVARDITPLGFPHILAIESNKIDYSFVFTYDDFSDLCSSSYYDDAIPLIGLRVAKQGYRLAVW
ncbi:nuclease Le1 [Desarmillaria ectypa]|nr:nuclease Le1 [Desarmillaria ectypa]